MKVKTSELTGSALDWAVAVCQGYSDLRRNCHRFSEELLMTPPRVEYGPVALHDITFSADWNQGGPIIEREKISIMATSTGVWGARTLVLPPDYSKGPTPLIAAMRCFVAARLGEEIEIPEELL